MSNVPDFLTCPLADLLDYRRDAFNNWLSEVEAHELAVAPLNAELDAIRAAVEARYTHRVVDAYGNRASGDVTVPLDGIAKLKGSRSKAVKWDGEALRKLATSLSIAEINHLFKIDFSIPESIYKALPPGPLKDKIDAARTVKYGALQIDLEDAREG
jgi:hypothetical protein